MYIQHILFLLLVGIYWQILEWPPLSGPVALGSIDNFNDEISTSIPFKHVNMFVNYLILNACVKTTEIAELTDAQLIINCSKERW
jgi:hypothetical protein